MAKRVLARLTALALSMLLCLLLGEAAVRVLDPQGLSVWAMTRDGMVIHQRNLRGHRTDAGVRIETNSVGMRDSEHPVSKPPGTFRVLLMGDSFMEAFQVEREQSLAVLLEARLEAVAAERVEVINASVSGWGTDDQLTYFRRYARATTPDLILVGMTLHNDVSDNLRGAHHSIHGGVLVERPRQELPWHRFAVQRIKEWLAGHSHLNQWIGNRLRAEEVREGGRRLGRHVTELVRRHPSPRIDDGWQLTEALLDELVRLAAEDGAAIAIFLIPLELQISDAKLEEQLGGAEVDRSELDLDAPQRRVLAWAGRRRVRVIDLLPAFRAWTAEQGRVPYLATDGHWDAEGHALATRAVAGELVESGVIRSSPAPR